MNVQEKFNFKTHNTSKKDVVIYLINNGNESIDLFDHNTIKIIYNDNVNTSLMDINRNNISSNLTKINTNESNITSNKTANENAISSNLGKITTNETSIKLLSGKYQDML